MNASSLPRLLTLVSLRSLVLGCALLGGGCATQFKVYNAPAAVEHVVAHRSTTPVVGARLQVANFAINQVDTQYRESGKQAFRRHFSIAIPHLLHDRLGALQGFAQIQRVTHPDTASTDYVLTGMYDFHERLGTQGRQWIPFAGLFGAPINRAWVKGEMKVILTRAGEARPVFEKLYVEEHGEKTSIYRQPYAGYLQNDHLALIVAEVIQAAEADWRARASTRAP